MKKLAALTMIAMLALVPCVCRATQAQVPNPMVEVESVETLAKQLNVALALPEGAQVSKCYVIGDTVGQVDYTWSSVDYVFRAKVSAEFEDISGIYGDFALVENLEFDAVTVTLCLNEGDTGMAEWFTNSTSYALMIEDGATEDALLEVLYQVLYA